MTTKCETCGAMSAICLKHFYCSKCPYVTNNRISLGMHRAYKHDESSNYRRWLSRKRNPGVETNRA